jgi:hypothetical protein
MPALQRWSNIVAYILVVVVNSLAGSTTLIGGRNTAEVSNAFPTLVTPAGYTFAIWGIIYLLLGIFVVYQALPKFRDGKFHSRIGWFFVISCALNIVWIFAWQNEYLGVSVLLMLFLLASLIIIYLRLDIGRSDAGRNEKLAVQLPFSVYLGWISIATIANISAMLVSVNWDGFGISPETWALLIIVVATLLACLMAIMRRDIAYELVIIWAFLGIYAKQTSYPTVQTALLAGLAVSAVVLAVMVFLSRGKTGKASPS